MTIIRNVALVAALTLVIANGPAQAEPQHSSTTEAAALAVVDAFHAALNRNDAKAAAAFLDDKVVIYEGGVAEQSKAEYATHHLKADGAFSSKMSETIVRRTDGAAGNFAWVASEGRTSGRYKDRDINLITTETMVLRRTNGTWKIIHIHWSSRAPSEH